MVAMAKRYANKLEENNCGVEAIMASESLAVLHTHTHTHK